MWTDPEGRESCVVVVKGTFCTNAKGDLTLSSEQHPWVHADEHYGDPETTCIRYECDFAPEKPMAEVIVVGKAVPPNGSSARQLRVRLEVQEHAKEALVFGDRRWARYLGGLTITDPLPFREMPLTFDRAFGGIDDSRSPENVSCEPRNLVGVGFNSFRKPSEVDGRPLPNVEHPSQQVQCPFLPEDFDSRYFMSASSDQWFPHFRGGELIRCVHMAEEAMVQYRLPTIAIPVFYHFKDRIVEQQAVCDTVIVEPHAARAILLWRTRAAIGKKLTELKGILVGAHPRSRDDDLRGHKNGKPHYRGLQAAIRWSSNGRAR